MLHQAMLSSASVDVENSENRLLFVPFSQTVYSLLRGTKVKIQFTEKLFRIFLFFPISILDKN